MWELQVPVPSAEPELDREVLTGVAGHARWSEGGHDEAERRVGEVEAVGALDPVPDTGLVVLVLRPRTTETSDASRSRQPLLACHAYAYGYGYGRAPSG